MQFDDDVKARLEAAAARPERGLDVQKLVRRGTRMRRARFAAAVGGLAIAVAGASASFGILGSDRRPQRAAEGLAGCPDPTSTISVLIRDDASDAEVDQLAQELVAEPDVVSVEYVSSERAYEEFLTIYEEETALPSAVTADVLPASFLVQTSGGEAATELSSLESPVVTDVAPAIFGGGPECFVQTFCAREVPSEVAIFLRDDAAPAAVRALKRELEASPGVDSVVHFTKHDAFHEFELLYRDDPEMLEAVTRNSLPASLRVHTTSEDAVERLEDFTSPLVEEVRTGGSLLEDYCPDPTAAPDPVVQVSPAPAEDEPRREPRAPVQVDLLRVECSIEPLRLGDGGVQRFAEGDKWCRFVLAVRNDGQIPIELERDAQMLRAGEDYTLTPWDLAMDTHFSMRLFEAPIERGRQRMGQLVFLLRPEDVPLALELGVMEGHAPVVIPLDYPCAADLREEPRGKCVFSPRDEGGPPYEEVSGPVEVSLYHCGVDPVRFAGQQWVSDPPPFDATNAPEDFTGSGTMTTRSEVEAVYVDGSGARIHFEVIEGWEPPICL